MDALEIMIVHLITLIPLCIFIIIAIFAAKTFLIIYPNGFKVKRNPWLPFYKFITWMEIKELKIYEKTKMMREMDGSLLTYEIIFVFLKNHSKPLKIPEIWIGEIQEAYQIMNEFIGPFQRPDFCKNHPEKESTRQCCICSDYFCDSCIDQRDFSMEKDTIITNCVLCSYINGFKKMAILYSVTLIFPFISLIFLLFNISLVGEIATLQRNFYYFFSSYNNAFRNDFFPKQIYALFEYNTFFIALTIPIVLINPYSYSIYFTNLIRVSRLNKDKVQYNTILPIIFTYFTFITILYYTILFSMVRPYFILYIIGTIILTLGFLGGFRLLGKLKYGTYD